MHRRSVLSMSWAALVGLLYRSPVRGASAPAVVHVDRATLSISWRGSEADLGRSGLIEWIERSGKIVSGYYGEFPLTEVAIQITIVPGARVMSGRTFGAPDAFIELNVGQQVSAQTLYSDWVLVHEMIHLALPEVSDEQNWLAEGLATYVEGIARVQAGNMSAPALWSEYVAQMPKGLPEAGDRGLDRTHTWARTYWGGALFCLLADVRIHEQSGNRRGLQDALRSIERQAGGMGERMSAERIFAIGDPATGTTVLHDLYTAMKDKLYAPDLAALWADLGIIPEGDDVRFDDGARLAAARRAITAPMR